MSSEYSAVSIRPFWTLFIMPIDSAMLMALCSIV